jgi:hypothetical protein
MVGEPGFARSGTLLKPSPVMPGPVPGIHVFLGPKTWMAGTSPAMTAKNISHIICVPRHFANRYAPPFSILRWNAGRACMRDSHALRFGYGPSLLNAFAMSPAKLI